jgi:hypothetical protein
MAHDVGGAPIHDSVPQGQHPFMPWEMRVDALMWVLTDGGRPGDPQMTVDELRRGIEALSPDDYRSLGYYEKWLLSMIAILHERGTIDREILERRAHEIAHERGHAHS